MKRVISLKPISTKSVSPQKQKRIRAERFSAFPRHSLKLSSPPPQNDKSVINEDNMPIPVSDNLRQWLVSKNLQDYIKVAAAEPHPRAEDLL